MPRGPRALLDNVFYHIVNRGNQKQNVFFDSADYIKYLEILKHYKRKYSVKLFGYCLMPNHVHLILRPNKPKNLPIMMQCLTQAYTAWFNAIHNKVGRLWQGRYKSMIIHYDAYFLECVYYVEQNPIRAQIVSSPKDYYWSSYTERVLGNKRGLLDLPDST